MLLSERKERPYDHHDHTRDGAGDLTGAEGSIAATQSERIGEYRDDENDDADHEHDSTDRLFVLHVCHTFLFLRRAQRVW